MPSRGAGRAQQIVLVTDPGPDPDDVKAILIAGTLHKRGDIDLRLVVTTGGQQARNRARLARCLLDAIDVRAVPVAIGSEGKPYEPVAHEYALKGYASVDDSRLETSAHMSLVRVLQSARAKAVVVVCIAGLSDVAELLAREPDLVLAKVMRIAVQAGLEFDEAAQRWAPDTSVNNEFDREAATAVYDFCFGKGLPLTAVSRHAVPLLPMQLARSFAERTRSPVMAYLANAQFLGLAGLWVKLCAGHLPARCTKQWFFETFCGIDRDGFERRDLGDLDGSTDIIPYLNGYVKPYDVVALMSVLPGKPADAVARCERADVRLSPSAPKAEHMLLLAPEHALDVTHVVQLLRNVYHDVVLSSAPLTPRVNRRIAHARLADHRELRGGLQRTSSTDGAVAEDSGHDWRLKLASGARVAPEVEGSASPKAKRRDVGGNHILSSAEIIELLDCSLGATRTRLQRVTRVAATICITLCAAGMAVYSWTSFEPQPGLSDVRAYERMHAVGIVAAAAILNAWVLGLLALQPIASHMRATTLIATIGSINMFGFAAILLKAAVSQLAHEPKAYMFCYIRPPPVMSVVSPAWVVLGALSVLISNALLAREWWRTRDVSPMVAQDMRLHALWLWTCVLTATLGVPYVALISWRCGHEGMSGVPYSPHFVPLVIFTANFALWLGVVLLLPPVRASVCALIDRAASGEKQHLVCALAPLVGYGTGEVVEPWRLVPEALRSLRSVELDEAAMRSLTKPAAAVQSGPQLLRLQRSDSSSVSPMSTPTAHPTRASRLPAMMLASPKRGHGKAGWNSKAASSGVAGRSILLSTTPVDVTDSRLLNPEKIDYYVLHSPTDPAELRTAALQRWARAHRAAHGAWPRVWIDVLCADPYLRRQQLLAHEVVALCRSRKLLCLVSPSLLEQLPFVGRLLAWRASGAALADVEVVVVGETDSERSAAIAAVDAFHIAYAAATHPAPLDAADGAVIERKAIAHAIGLAGPARVNTEVRALLPAVQRETELERSFQGSLPESETEAAPAPGTPVEIKVNDAVEPAVAKDLERGTPARCRRPPELTLTV